MTNNLERRFWELGGFIGEDSDEDRREYFNLVGTADQWKAEPEEVSYTPQEKLY